MSFLLLLNSVTLDDLERRNSSNRFESLPNSVDLGADYVKVVVRYTNTFCSKNVNLCDCRFLRRVQIFLLTYLLCLATKNVDLWRNLCAIILYFIVAYMYDVVIKKFYVRYLIS